MKLIVILLIVLYMINVSYSQEACTTTNCDDNPSYELQCLEARCSRGVCVTNELICDKMNPCFEGNCVVGTGCVYTVRNCSNAKFCDFDFKCNATTNGCQHRTDPNCIECESIGCTTTDFCQLQVCSDDGESCISEPKDCDDNIFCTEDSCTSPDGTCQHQMIPGCVNCPGTDFGCVTVDRCNPQICPTDNSTTCVNTTKSCDDGNYCTTDLCSGNGTCSNEQIENCINCAGIGCITTDFCQNQVCSDDGQSCVSEPKDCEDGDLCSTSSCISPGGQCSQVPIICNDNDPCTSDSCVAASGNCTFATIPNCAGCQALGCNTTDECFPKTCVNGTECRNDTKQCNDNKYCTNDECMSPTGQCISTDIPNCVECQYVGCITTDLCFPQLCPTGGSTTCINSTKSCDDGNYCTTDSCENGICINEMIPMCRNCSGIGCITLDRCFPQICSADGNSCVNTTRDCDDGLFCTEDTCYNNTCINTIIPNCVECLNGTGCITDDPCAPRICSNDGESCVDTIKDCDDNNHCTEDSCIEPSGTCANSIIPNCIDCGSIGCITTDNCIPQLCSPAGDSCVSIPKSCNDGELCTTDSCLSPSGNCSNVRIPGCGNVGCSSCITTNPCEPKNCTEILGCRTFPVDCNDHDRCTTDSCIPVDNYAKCVNLPILGCGVPFTTGHYTESGTGNPHTCDRKDCPKGHECHVINNKAECVPQKYQCLDCFDLQCHTQGLSCIMVENPRYFSKKHEKHGCIGEDCCKFTPTCKKFKPKRA